MQRPFYNDFVIANDRLLSIRSIKSLDLSRIEDLVIVIHHDAGSEKVERIQAIECLMQLRPSALENRRLRWKKHAWSLHNLIGHPLMQIFAYMRCYRFAMLAHDLTVPRPLGKRQ